MTLRREVAARKSDEWTVFALIPVSTFDFGVLRSTIPPRYLPVHPPIPSSFNVAMIHHHDLLCTLPNPSNTASQTPSL